MIPFFVSQESAKLEPEAHLDLVRTVSAQLLSSLAFLHSHGIAHADLKPENILLTRPMDEVLASPKTARIRIVDFGSAIHLRGGDLPLTHDIQTLQYRAPGEALLQRTPPSNCRQRTDD